MTAEEEEALRVDFRDNDREVQRSAWMYMAGVTVLLAAIVGSGTPLLRMIGGNAGYNAFAFLALALFNVVFACYLFYRSLNIHETMQLLVMLTPPDSGMLHWEAFRRSNQSATRPVRPFYFAVLLSLPLLVSFAILFGLHRVLWATHVLDARWTPLWIAWFTVLALHALPLWFGYHNLRPTPARWKVIANLRGLEPSYFDTSDPQEDGGWPVDAIPQPDGSVLAHLGPEDVVVLSHPSLHRFHHTRGFTLNRDSLHAIEQLGARRVLLHTLTAALGDAERVEIRFAHT
ncbi:MAG TPA: hypothetical protein VFJ16_23545 [Longimicrobium sp.]|nr:hypothetical protein [Longimicrobium sp.]